MGGSRSKEGNWPIRLNLACADTSVVILSRAAAAGLPGVAVRQRVGWRAVESSQPASAATRRAAAAIADAGVCVLLVGALSVSLSVLLRLVPPGVEAPLAALAVVAVIGAPLAYVVLGESRYGQTFGKRLFGLTVQGLGGGPLPAKVALERVALRASPVTWTVVGLAACRARLGAPVHSPYNEWTRSLVFDQRSGTPVGGRQRPHRQRRRQDRGAAALAPARSACRCGQLRQLEGADAEVYAVEHLVALARYPRHGRASLLCQETSTAWMAHEDPLGEREFRLHRVAQLPPVIPRP